MDKFVLYTFVEYYNKGDRCQNDWKSHVYIDAVKNVREKGSLNITKKNKKAKGYRYKVVKFWDAISLVYCKDQTNGEAARTTSESSKEIAREDGGSKDPAGSSATSGRLKRQRSDDSFSSMWSEKLDLIATAFKDDGPKVPASTKVFATLQEIGLDEDTEFDLYDILTFDARKFESIMALPMERRKRWLIKQIKK